MTGGATADVNNPPQVIEETLFLHLFICVLFARRRRLKVTARIIQFHVVLVGIGHPAFPFRIGAAKRSQNWTR